MINDHITELFKDENINNRDDVIAELKAQNYEITAVKPKSISIKTKIPCSIKTKGKLHGDKIKARIHNRYFFPVLRTFKKYTYRDLVQGDKPHETPQPPRTRMR